MSMDAVNPEQWVDAHGLGERLIDGDARFCCNNALCGLSEKNFKIFMCCLVVIETAVAVISTLMIATDSLDAAVYVGGVSALVITITAVVLWVFLSVYRRGLEQEVVSGSSSPIMTVPYVLNA